MISPEQHDKIESSILDARAHKVLQSLSWHVEETLTFPATFEILMGLDETMTHEEIVKVQEKVSAKLTSLGWHHQAHARIGITDNPYLDITLSKEPFEPKKLTWWRRLYSRLTWNGVYL
jgi:hypothetical protein